MPTYCYRRRDNQELIEIEMTMGEMMDRQVEGAIETEDGIKADRSYIDEQCTKPVLSDYEWTSSALAVHPVDVGEHRKWLKKHNIPAEVLPDGRIRATSQKARADVLKLYGAFDKQGYYTGSL